jgi:hypothetical protein
MDTGMRGGGVVEHVGVRGLHADGVADQRDKGPMWWGPMTGSDEGAPWWVVCGAPFSLFSLRRRGRCRWAPRVA